MHLDMTVTFGIGIPQLVHIISLALASTFAMVERSQVHVTIADERVAHDKHAVEPLVATRDETGTECLLPPKGRLDRRHAGRSHLQPDELPVEVKVVGQELAFLESRVLNAALCARCQETGHKSYDGKNALHHCHFVFIG